MTLTALFLGFVLSSLFAAVFHLFTSRELWKLLVFLVASWIGFFLGHFIGDQLNIPFDQLGDLHIGLATILAFSSLFFAHWLTRIEAR